MEENQSIQPPQSARVEINADGSIDPDQLAGLPENIQSQLVDALTGSVLMVEPGKAPYLKIRERTGRRESRRKPIRTFHVEQFIGDQARNIVKDRKRYGLSARQFKRATKLARQIARDTMRSE